MGWNPQRLGLCTCIEQCTCIDFSCCPPHGFLNLGLLQLKVAPLGLLPRLSRLSILGQPRLQTASPAAEAARLVFQESLVNRHRHQLAELPLTCDLVARKAAKRSLSASAKEAFSAARATTSLRPVPATAWSSGAAATLQHVLLKVLTLQPFMTLAKCRKKEI